MGSDARSTPMTFGVYRKTGGLGRGMDKKNPADSNLGTASPLSSDINMRVDFLFNRTGGAWLLHDKPLPDILKWIEYDSEKETIVLVTRSGRLDGLGLRIPVEKKAYLERAMEVTALLMHDGFVKDFAVVPMVTTHMTVN